MEISGISQKINNTNTHLVRVEIRKGKKVPKIYAVRVGELLQFSLFVFAWVVILFIVLKHFNWRNSSIFMSHRYRHCLRNFARDFLSFFLLGPWEFVCMCVGWRGQNKKIDAKNWASVDIEISSPSKFASFDFESNSTLRIQNFNPRTNKYPNQIQSNRHGFMAIGFDSISKSNQKIKLVGIIILYNCFKITTQFLLLLLLLSSRSRWIVCCQIQCEIFGRTTSLSVFAFQLFLNFWTIIGQENRRNYMTLI